MVGQNYFFNPFKKHDLADFADVYRPLNQSDRKSSIVSVPKKSLDDKDVEDGGEPGAFAPNSIESLRAEIDADVAASGHDSVYDRMSSLGWLFGPRLFSLPRARAVPEDQTTGDLANRWRGFPPVPPFSKK